MSKENKHIKKINSKDKSNLEDNLTGEQKWVNLFKTIIKILPIMIVIYVLSNRETVFKQSLSLIEPIKESIPFLQKNLYSLELDIDTTNSELNKNLEKIDIWELEKIIVGRNDYYKRIGIKYEYFDKIIDCKEVNITCFMQVRKEFNFKKKIIATSSRVEVGYKYYFDRLKKKWSIWSEEERKRYIYSLLESQVFPQTHFPDWLKKEKEAKSASTEWFGY